MKRGTPSGDVPVSPPLTKRKLTSTTTNKAVSSFFKPNSQKEPEKSAWKIIDNTLVIGQFCDPFDPAPHPKSPVKIAAFDLDDTIITPNSSNRFNRNATSWKWWDPIVPQRLHDLHNAGYLIIVISNQMAISVMSKTKVLGVDSQSLKNFKDQLASISKQLAFPFTVYAATGGDRYRKPRVGMWERIKEDLNLQEEDVIDMEESFFVGDAAGRDKTDKRKKDHATSDRDFAANVGIKFKTPEEFFLDLEAEPYSHLFEPQRFLDESASAQIKGPAFTKKNPQELVVFCGFPGAGKSSYYWKQLQPHGYERVNQDILKTRDKCLRVTRQFLEDAKSVVVDNTNRDRETRKHWLKLAEEFRVPVRCIYFSTSARLAEHNDAVRALNSSLNPENRTVLPAIAFRGFAQNFQQPQLDEGFQDITTVDFQFEGSDAEKAVWSQHWVSKFSL